MDRAHGFKSLDRSVRKQKIIDTAAALFHKKGYSSATLDDLSRELGISKAALYHYVKSKDELLSIIYTQAFENIFRDTYEISGMDLSPDEKLRRIVRNHINNIIIKDLSMFSVFFSEESQLPKKDFRKIRDEKRKYTRIIEDIILEGIRMGIFKKVDVKLQAYAILGMCNWIYKWYKPGKTNYSPEEIADHFIALLESGYMKRKDAGEGMETRKDLSRRLRAQCAALSALADELERGSEAP